MSGLRSGPRRVIGGLVVVAMFAWGTSFYGLGFYLLRLHEIRGWSVTAISNIVLVFYLAAVLLSFGVAKQLARRGPRPVITVGAVAIGGALIAMPRVDHLGWLLVVYLVLSVGWSATNTNPISTTVLAWFPSGQRPLSIALVGASLGGIVVIPLLGQLDERFGFSMAVTTLGVATIVVVGGVALTVIDGPPDPISARPVGRPGSPPSTQRPDRLAWSIATGLDFWIVAAALAASIVVQGGFLVHQLAILATVVSPTAAANIVGLATAAAFAGRFGPVVVGDRVAPAVVGATYLAVQAAALGLLGLLEHTGGVLTDTRRGQAPPDPIPGRSA